jgi:hypothetical protein
MGQTQHTFNQQARAYQQGYRERHFSDDQRATQSLPFAFTGRGATVFEGLLQLSL